MMNPVRICIFLVVSGLANLCVADAPVVRVVLGPKSTDPSDGLRPGPLNQPFAIEIDPAGNRWIVEYEGGRVLRSSSAQPDEWTVLAGPNSATAAGAIGYVDGAGGDARFNKLHNLAIDARGHVYLSDHLNHAIRRLRQVDGGDWVVDSFAGNGKPGPAAASISRESSRWQQPICVTHDRPRDRLLVADIGNRVIRAIDLGSGDVSIVAGTGKRGVPTEGGIATEQPLLDPRAADVSPGGGMYVLERGGHCLRYVDPSGRITTVAGSGKKGFVDGVGTRASMSGPKHLDVASDGRVFIADDDNHAVRVFDPTTGQLSTVDVAPYVLKRPHGVLVHEGSLFIVDSYHHRVLEVAVPAAN